MKSLTEQLDGLRAGYQAHPFPSIKERRAHLQLLFDAVHSNRDAIAKAIDKDFGGRTRIEVDFSEIFVTLNGIRHARKHVKEWMARRKRDIAFTLQPASAWVMPQPVGVVGIIVPWNYPLFLSMGPLAGALAAGNRAMLKLSEFTPATSEVLAALIASTFDANHVTVVNGDAAVGSAFSHLPFDHLLFTGSTEVGRKVMLAAAETLTPVTLELGGKSPVLIAPDANLGRAADDIVYGKFLNAGQTCIAPDYILAPAERVREVADALRQCIERRYPNASQNSDYTSIINDRQFDRLQGYLKEARERGVETISLGPAANGRKLPPTLLIDPPDDLRVMQEEIFGPILPLKSYRTVDDAIRYVNARPRPLALYLFAGSSRIIKDVLNRTISGGVCVNDTLMQIVVDDLPFGGIGASGIGHYHGREGFDTFSKLKPVFRRYGIGFGIGLRPPYGRLHAMMRRILIG